jgi:two-component system, NarL family, sensor kinase
MKFLISYTIFSFLLYNAFSQSAIEISKGFENKKELAILELKKFTKNDTARVNALWDVIKYAIFLKQKESVKKYYDETLLLSRKLNYSKGLAKCYYWMALYCKSAKDSIKLIAFSDSLILLGTLNPNSKYLTRSKAMGLNLKGQYYNQKENYLKALPYFLESLKYFESNLSEDSEDLTKGNRKLLHYLYNDISSLYLSISNQENALEFYKKNILFSQMDTSDYLNVVESELQISNIYFEQKRYEDVKNCLKRIDKYMPNSEEIMLTMGYYRQKGKLFFTEQSYDSGYFNFKQALNYAEKVEHNNSISTCLYYLAQTCLKINKNTEALIYANRCLSLARLEDDKQQIAKALEVFSIYDYKIGNHKLAYDLLKQSIAINDSLFSISNNKQINTLKAVYETEKKENEIFLLQSEKKTQASDIKQKSTLNKILIGSAIGLILFSLLGYRNFKNKQKVSSQQQELQKQKITELEKDKQLSAIDAMLQGQEEERSRIAKDLHDGLGGMLSGTKLSFINMKENLVLTPENATQFDKSLSMLDNTIADLRKVAHNLMPEALVKFGLQEAVRDFCNSIQSSTNLKVVYQPLGDNRKLSNTAEVFTYRIIQELVNNAVKHANATQIIVQLTTNNNKVSIAVEDDGKGFDANALANSKGAGMDNIKYRVQYFNGTIDTVTSVGNGTSVNIELSV